MSQWNNSGKRSIDCSGPSGSPYDIQKHSSGITVTTVLSQESVARNEETSSTRELVVEAV